MAQLLQLARSIFMFLMIADLILSAPPDNPCPELFQYKLVDKKWIGIIELTNIKEWQAVQLNVSLTLPTYLQKSSYFGSIGLLYKYPTTIRIVVEGGPLIFKINFPLQDPLPKITEIMVDNVVLCKGPPDRAPNVTDLKLYYYFKPTVSGYANRFGLEMPSTETASETPTETSTEAPLASTPSLISHTEVCGESHLNPASHSTPIKQFVINGEPTVKGEWPWLVAIFTTNGPANPIFQCGGTLLTSKVTITASHCLFREGLNEPLAPSEVIIALGRYKIQSWVEPGSLYLNTERIEFPPDYIKTDSFEMDIGVVVHNSQVNFAEYPFIRPICFWSGSNSITEIEGHLATVVGWGEDEKGNKPSPIPKKVNVPIVSRRKCIRGSTQLELFTSSTNFCAGKKDGRGPCHGDSGGGLVMKNNGRWELRGIIAGTVQKGVPNTDLLCNLDEYVVYVDIIPFRDWIFKMMDI